MFRRCFHGQHANYLLFVCGAEARLTEPQREPKESLLFLLSNYLSEGCIQFDSTFYLIIWSNQFQGPERKLCSAERRVSHKSQS